MELVNLVDQQDQMNQKYMDNVVAKVGLVQKNVNLVHIVHLLINLMENIINNVYHLGMIPQNYIIQL